MRFVKSLILGGLGLVPLATLLPGCVENESSFFVERALRLGEDADCVYEVDLPSYATGEMDLSLTNTYGLMVSVANQVQALGDPNLLRTETSYIRLEGAEVSIEGLAGASSAASNARASR